MSAPLTTAARHARAARTIRERLDRALAARDEAIVEAIREGVTLREIAEACEIDAAHASRVGMRVLGRRPTRHAATS